MTGSLEVGGLSGGLWGTLKGSYASDAVTGSSFVGGLVGGSSGTVTQSYATGAVTGIGGSSFVGGLIGANGGGTVIQSYANGSVTAGSGSSSVGGLIGGNPGVATSSYWDMQTSGQTVSAGGTGLTTAQFLAGLPSGFDATVWGSQAGFNSGYPFLLWQLSSGYEVVEGYVYGDAGVTRLGAGVTVSGLVDGVSLSSLAGVVTTGANGSYNFVLAPGVISASGSQLLTYTTGANAGAAYLQNATGSVYDLNIFAGYLNETTGASALSAVSAGLSTAIGGNTSVKALVSGLPNLSISATAASFSIDQPIAMTGALTLDANGTIGATAAVNVGAFTLAGGNWTQLGNTLPSFSAQNFIVTGGSFLRALGGNGSTGSPYQISDVYGLQGIGSSPALLADNYAVAGNIDATGTANWNGGAGFAPIGNAATNFTGAFDGQGHTISNLTINLPAAYVGLFGIVGSAGSIENLGIVNINLTSTGWNGSTGDYAHVGALAGLNDGTISGSSATGAIVSNSLYSTAPDTGGLVGTNSGQINQSSASVNVTDNSTGGSLYLGGLIGRNEGEIIQSSATGTVSSSSTDASVGGLVGYSPGSIAQSYATGAVSLTGKSVTAGGLVGYIPAGASISNSYATGSVTVASNGAADGYSVVGGLVGQNSGAISGSYATGAVVGGSYSWIGGLVGRNANQDSSGNAIAGASIDSSYAKGAVSASGVSDNVGGLVGWNDALSTITNSHAGGNVSATATLPNQSDFEFINIGGLVGQNSGSVSGSYATGTVVAAGSLVGRANSYTDAGGLVGYNEGAISGSSYATGAVTVGTNSSAGGLVGENGVKAANGNPISGATITNAYATGAVSSLGVDVTLGGLAGENDPLSTITNSYATGNVSATGTIAGQNCTGSGVCDYLFAGGLVGQTYGTIAGPSWTTKLTVANAPTACVAGYTCASGAVIVGSLGDGGGLVGFNNGVIANAFAISNVIGASGLSIAIGSAGANLTRLGGLAGDNMGQITNSFALGAVGSPTTANLDIGGLVAKNYGLISGSFAKVTLSAGDNSIAGGLAANNLLADSSSCYYCYTGYSENVTETISNSNAYGGVTVGASGIAGGLVGESDFFGSSIPGGGSIANSNAFGAVAAGGDSIVGGLLGAANSVISASAAQNTLVSSTGANSIVGGLVGFNAGSITTSDASAPVSGGDDSYVGGLVGFNIGSVTQSTVDPPITAGANSFVGGIAGLNLGSISGVTGQAAITSGSGSIVGGVAGVNGAYPSLPSSIPGSSYPNGTIANSTTTGTGFSSSVGATSPTSSPAFPSWLSNCNGPLCSVVAQVRASQTASAGVVTYTIADTSSTYGMLPTLGTVTLIGAPAGTTATVEVFSGSTPITLTANSPAGIYTEIVTLLSNPNFTIASSGNVEGILTIDPATLTYTASAASRTYGSGNPLLGGMVTGFVAGDTLASATTGTLVFSTGATPGSNVGNYAITGGGLTANNGNYVFVQAAGNAAALTIAPVPVTVTALGGFSVYGSSPSNPGLSATGLQNGQDVSALTGLTNSFGITSASTVAGSPYTLSVTGVLSNPNYIVTATNNGVWIIGSPQTITPVPTGTLNLTANPAPAVSNNQAKAGGCSTPGFGFNAPDGEAPMQVAGGSSWRNLLSEIENASALKESISGVDEIRSRRDMAFFGAAETTALERRIGNAVITQNEVDNVDGTTPKTIKVGDEVFSDETVRTGEDSTGKFVFVDETNLAMGPRATVKLDRFVFSGESTYSEAVINLTVGTFRFITGKSQKKAYAIQTPVATVGVRGTIVDIKVDKGGTTVALVEGGAVVCPRGNPRNCAQLKPGETANVKYTKAAVGPTHWTFASACTGNGALCGQTSVAAAATTIATAQRLAMQSSGENPCAP